MKKPKKTIRQNNNPYQELLRAIYGLSYRTTVSHKGYYENPQELKQAESENYIKCITKNLQGEWPYCEYDLVDYIKLI